VNRRDFLSLAAAGAALQLRPAWADAYPSRPIRLVVPFAPGGSVDVLARIISEPLTRIFGQPVIVDNKGGAGGAIGTMEVAKLPQWGMLSFMVAIIKTLFLYYKGPVIQIDYDGQSLTTDTLMFLTMNGRRMGNGFQMAPDSKMDDGLFDLVLARQVSRMRIFSLIPHFMKGTQGSQPEIRTMRAAWVHIQALQGTLPAQSDGEILCVDGTQLDIEILPRQIEVVCAPKTG
jgi:hypothetical protein